MVQCAACPNKTSNIVEENAVKCIGCDRLYHRSCAKRLIKDYGQLPSGAFTKCCGSSDDLLQYKLLKNQSSNYTESGMQDLGLKSVYVDKNGTQLPDSQIDQNDIVTNSQLRLEMDNLLSNLKELLNENKNAITDLKNHFNEKFDSITNKLEHHDSLFDEAFSRLSAVEDNMKNASCVNIEETIYEINDRKRRELNLIFYNVPDSSDADKDKQTIVHLLPVTMRDNSVTRVFRIGKPRYNLPSANNNSHNTQSNVQPLKVIFSSHDHVQWLFENRQSLQLNGMTFTADRTVRQRSLYNAAKTDLNNRLKNGESNLRIKTVMGIPKVISISGNAIKHQNGSNQKNSQRGRTSELTQPN